MLSEAEIAADLLWNDRKGWEAACPPLCTDLENRAFAFCRGLAETRLTALRSTHSQG